MEDKIDNSEKIASPKKDNERNGTLDTLCSVITQDNKERNLPIESNEIPPAVELKSILKTNGENKSRKKAKTAHITNNTSPSKDSSSRDADKKKSTCWIIQQLILFNQYKYFFIIVLNVINFW